MKRQRKAARKRKQPISGKAKRSIHACNNGGYAKDKGLTIRKLMLRKLLEAPIPDGEWVKITGRARSAENSSKCVKATVYGYRTCHGLYIPVHPWMKPRKHEKLAIEDVRAERVNGIPEELRAARVGPRPAR